MFDPDRRLSDPSKRVPFSFKIVPEAQGYTIHEEYVFGSARSLETFLNIAPLGDEFHVTIVCSYGSKPLSYPPDMSDNDAYVDRIKELTGV